MGLNTDNETGVVLQGHRYYDPAMGRWLTRDPIGYAGGINLYGYVGGDPVNGSDPSGLDTLVFGGTKLKWFGDDGRLIRTTPAYSGGPGTSCRDQRSKGGPIPEGVYFISPRTSGYASWNPIALIPFVGLTPYPAWTRHAWGDRRVPIKPEPGTNTFGRNKFFLHGGDEIGSAGCIDIGPADVSWIDQISVQKFAFKVIVDYGNWKGAVPSTDEGEHLPWGN